MSCTVRAVPRTVPVTFDAPTRGRYGTSTSVTRQRAAAARTTISSGHPNRRSRRPSSSNAVRRAARIGPRSRSGRPVRRRTSSARTRFAKRACSGHAPQPARQARERQAKANNCNYFVPQMVFGSMTPKEALRSIELFAKDIMPAFAA